RPVSSEAPVVESVALPYWRPEEVVVAQWRRALDLQSDPLGDLAAHLHHLRSGDGAYRRGDGGGPELDDDCERLGGQGVRSAVDVGAAGVRDALRHTRPGPGALPRKRRLPAQAGAAAGAGDTVLERGLRH